MRIPVVSFLFNQVVQHAITWQIVDDDFMTRCRLWIVKSTFVILFQQHQSSRHGSRRLPANASRIGAHKVSVRSRLQFDGNIEPVTFRDIAVQNLVVRNGPIIDANFMQHAIHGMK